MGVFDTTDKFPDLPIDDTLGYSGLRLRAELKNRASFRNTPCFRGPAISVASAPAKSMGLSARGLALKTGDPMGEEFPDFTAFWLETPAA